ncbi:MAG: tyrosine-type recombinase/integrase [Oscillospiraceae bacterium]|nr:tyrosine-type recombinase/integrase [Oscillospiraceae bacterium]
MLELLFSTGLRVSELCALSKETFLLENDELRLLVNGKGNKERVLQIATPELLRLAQTYCNENAISTAKPVFSTHPRPSDGEIRGP